MDNISPTVITSKAAQNHLNDIKFQHADILTGIQNQAVKVADYNAQKEAQRQIDEQQKQVQQSEAQKTAFDNKKIQMDAETKNLEAQNKAKELEIKSQALTM